MRCRGSLLPDPRYDAVAAVVLTMMDDNEDVADMRYTTRVLACEETEAPQAPKLVLDDLQVGPGAACAFACLCCAFKCSSTVWLS